MNLSQLVYFMALVGGVAGLASWTAQAWLSDVLVIDQESQWISQGLNAVVMGGSIAGLTVGFADHWSADRFVGRWAAVGAGLGILAGIISTVLYYPIARSLILDQAAGPALIGRVITWMVTGGLIGLATGLRWFGVNRLRAFHALTGGLIGGLIGGLLFVLLGSSVEFQALAFVLTGVGITLGVTLAPVLLRDGILRFVSSDDARAQNKYGPPRQEWLVQDGDRLVIGSLSASMTMTAYSRAVHIYLPDAEVAPMHAVLYGRNRRFFVETHPDNVGPQQHPDMPLQVNDQTVVRARELHHGDEVLCGGTLMVFLLRKQTARREASGRGSGDRR